MVLAKQGGVVVSTLRIVPLPKQRFEVLEILRSVQGPTLAHPGCQGCRIYEEQGPEHSILLCGLWESETALHEHIRSGFYRRVLSAVELSSRAPEVCFHHVSATEGMELIEKLRSGCGDAEAVSSATPGHLGRRTDLSP